MKRPGLAALASIAAGALVVACSDQASGVVRPPEIFQGDNWAVVQWVDVAEVDAACRAAGAAADGRIQGCAKGRNLILPNPCRLDGYSADVTCHELGHVNGWTHAPAARAGL
ncbi:hypothetical protein [uncultured Caulobacter sp.]|uniref:hypothetical protein n=1 Tax=uncultured Caulobacter sp. TaxID=158749 RepID=UPI00261A7A14|nr:hypothetical protein [uncultured Caulobacter sp.]